MEPLIVTLSGFTVAGHMIHTSLRDDANLRDIPAFWAEYDAHLRAPLLAAMGKEHAVEYGVVCGFDPASGKLDYLVGIECPPRPPALPPGVMLHTLKTSEYAVFSTPPSDDDGFGHAIVSTWNYAYQQWLPNSGRQPATAESFERYDGRCSPGRPDRVMDIYLPLVPIVTP